MNTKKSDKRRKSGALRYIDYLLTQAQQYAGKRSGKRTKLRLLASAAGLFEKIAPSDIRVSDICKGADMSQGTFYMHFETKNDVIIELLSRFVDFEIGTMPVFDEKADGFDNVVAMVDWYEDSFRLNAGIMLYMVRLSDVVPEIAGIWQRRADNIVDRLMQWMSSQFRLRGDQVEYSRLMCYSVGSMMDESLFARFGVHGAAQSAPDVDPRLLAELHAVLIHRAMFASNPPSDKLSVGKVFLPLLKTD